jgi:hypothetical protein
LSRGSGCSLATRGRKWPRHNLADRSISGIASILPAPCAHTQARRRRTESGRAWRSTSRVDAAGRSEHAPAHHEFAVEAAEPIDCFFPHPDCDRARPDRTSFLRAKDNAGPCRKNGIMRRPGRQKRELTGQPIRLDTKPDNFEELPDNILLAFFQKHLNCRRQN